MSAVDRDPTPLPAGLRERVLAASLRSRDPGRPVPDVPDISAAEAFSRAADAFYGLLRSLSEQDWHRPALRGLDVQGLVGHLIGVEGDTQRCLADDPNVAEADHITSTQAAADRQIGRSPELTCAEWRHAADRTLEAVRALELADSEADVKVAMHGMRLPLRALLVVRAFELWIHDNDVRLAAGLPATVPDAAALRLMTDLAIRLLPYAAARIGVLEPVDLHLVLTGPGGGTWDVAVGRDVDRRPGDGVAMTMVADAAGFCRLAGNRIGPDELDPYVTGACDRAAEVLAAAAALALD